MEKKVSFLNTFTKILYFISAWILLVGKYQRSLILCKNSLEKRVVASADLPPVVQNEKLFGPPSGGIIRERKGVYRCWAKRNKDPELTSLMLSEVNTSSEWPKDTGEDAFMMKKAWDFAPRWRALNVLPSFAFLRNLFSQEVMDTMASIDYVTHRSLPEADLIALDSRYEQHLFYDFDNFGVPCAPWLQYDGDKELPPASDEFCFGAHSCDACVSLDGCGWCTSLINNSYDGKCVGKDEGCDTFDRHLCHDNIIGAFDCGPCTGGTEAVMQISSMMNQMGIRNIFASSCPKHLLECGYDVPFLKTADVASQDFLLPRAASLWTCLGCNHGEWMKRYSTFLEKETIARKYLLALGHHKEISRKMKVKGWSTIAFLHNEFAITFESGSKPFYSGIGRFWYENEMKLDDLEPIKENIVVYDVDSHIDWACVRSNSFDPVTKQNVNFDVKWHDKE